MTTPTERLLSSLLERAEAATPGRWVRWSYEGPARERILIRPHTYSICRDVPGDDSKHVCVATAYSKEDGPCPDADFISSADPAVVSALCRIAEAARKMEAERQKTDFDKYAWTDALEAFLVELSALDKLAAEREIGK